MKPVFRGLMGRVLLLAMGGWLCQGGCVRDVGRELEVLFRAPANPALVYQSFLVNRFGSQVLGWFN